MAELTIPTNIVQLANDYAKMNEKDFTISCYETYIAPLTRDGCGTYVCTLTVKYKCKKPTKYFEAKSKDKKVAKKLAYADFFYYFNPDIPSHT